MPYAVFFAFRKFGIPAVRVPLLIIAVALGILLLPFYILSVCCGEGRNRNND